MSRQKNPVPTYRKYHDGRGCADVTGANGKRTRVYFPGAFGSDESKAAYSKMLDRLRSHGGKLPARPGEMVADDLTIDELIARFLIEKVEVEYRLPDGSATSEQICIRRALIPLSRLYGWAIAREFDAASLEKVRETMITGSWMKDDERERLINRGEQIGWSRGTINKSVSRIRSMFRWAVLKKVVTAATVVDLQCLPPLKRGRGARESDPVVPVEIDIVDATLPHLPPVVADMVRVQLLTGCRPGELCSMTVEELDRSGPVWLYTPSSHKTAHHGHKRTIAIGPQGQLILRRHLRDEGFVFSPAEQAKLIAAEKRAKRKSKVPPSQVDRTNPNAKRKPKDRFTVTAYNRAIARGCEKARVEHWHAHRLRHTAARQIAREFSSEAARATLGHKSLRITNHYEGIDVERAKDVASKIG